MQKWQHPSRNLSHPQMFYTMLFSSSGQENREYVCISEYSRSIGEPAFIVPAGMDHTKQLLDPPKKRDKAVR